MGYRVPPPPPMPARMPFVDLDVPASPPRPGVDVRWRELFPSPVVGIDFAPVGTRGRSVFIAPPEPWPDPPSPLQTRDTFPPPPPRSARRPSGEICAEDLIAEGQGYRDALRAMQAAHDASRQDPEPPTGSWRWRIAFAGATAAAVAYWLKFILPLLV